MVEGNFEGWVWMLGSVGSGGRCLEDLWGLGILLAGGGGAGVVGDVPHLTSKRHQYIVIIRVRLMFMKGLTCIFRLTLHTSQRSF